MKKFTLTVTALVLAMLFAITALATNGEFDILDGVLQKYNGSAAVVTIPDGVTNIKADAFAEAVGITTVIINSDTCDFEAGTFPAGTTINANTNSKAQLAATRDGLTFVPFVTEKFVNVKIDYTFSNGSTAAPSYTAQIKAGEAYSVTSPAVSGYTPSLAVVEGTAGETDVAVTVIYNATLADGWSIKDGKAKYIKNGSYVKGAVEDIDGVSYTFDEAGNAVIASGFLNVGSNTYYFLNSTAVTGYRIITKFVYYFNTDGTMLKGGSVGEQEFDISGHMMGSNIIVTIGGKSYYLLGDELSSGFKNIDGNIRYFGDDYSMAVNTTLNGYTFDKAGNLTAGIKIEDLEISKLSDVAYTGSAHKPSLTVKFKGIPLVEGTHYKLTYSNNTEPGTASVKLSGLGSVSGEATLTFTILGENAFTLTIKYVNVMGAPIAESYVTQMEPGTKFDVPTPYVEGYRPDQDTVSGVMGESDITITVTFTKVQTESESSTDTTDPLESTDVTASSPEDTDPNETEVKEKTEITGYTYNYSLLIKVFIIATLVTGIAIVLILNWDVIKKYFEKLKKSKNTSTKK